MKKNIIFTTLFKKNVFFWDEFIESVNNQKQKNFILVILVNEKINNLSNLERKIQVPYKIIKIYKKPIKSRILALKKLSEINPRLIIFIDSDDIMKNNRVSEICKNLKKNDFLVHNMKVFFKDKKINFLKKKNQSIFYNDIHRINFIGLSNLAVKYSKLKNYLNYSKKIEKLNAFDWYLAKRILIDKIKGIYISKVLTLYRISNKDYFFKKKIDKIKLNKDLNIVIRNLNYFNSPRFQFCNKKTISEIKKKYSNKKHISANYNYQGWYSYL